MKPDYEYKTPEPKREYYKGHYHLLINIGLCPVCGQRKPKEGVKLCEECMTRRREAERLTRNRRHARHECELCGKPMSPLETHKNCFSCRKIMCEYAEKRKEAKA